MINLSTKFEVSIEDMMDHAKCRKRVRLLQLGSLGVIGNSTI